MKTNIVYLYVLNTLADWEPGFATSELNSGRYFKNVGTSYPVKTVGLTKDPIITMGGVTILPDVTVGEINPDNCALLLLPGADTWREPQHAPVLEKTKVLLSNNVPVAAICGATIALANAGILDNRPHTSNDLEFLKAMCPSYKGEKQYQTKPAVTDDNLITANGVAPLDFAYHILKKLDVLKTDTLEAWYKLYQTHDPQYFYALMDSLPKK